jgi:spore maturation protein CgeB
MLVRCRQACGRKDHFVHLGLIGHRGPDMFADNIADSLVRMGHRASFLGTTHVQRGGRLAAQISEFAFAAFSSTENRFHQRLVRRAVELECDAVITTEGGLSPDAVAALRRNNIPVALWFPDHVSNLGRQRMLTAPYSALFFKEPLLVDRLRNVLGLPVWYMPECCNPQWHRPIGPAGTERAIVVIGNTYPSRIMLLRRMHDAGIPLVIYGGPPPRWAADLLPPGLHTGRALFREDKARAFRSAAGVLNNLHPAEIDGVNCRLFEASGSGAAVLCEYRPVLPDLFDLEREVVPFRNFDELVDRAWELLDQPGRTEEIGNAASKRAHSEHTYEARLPGILDKLA